MSVRQRKWVDAKGRPQSAWVVDVVFTMPDGKDKRVTKTSPVNTKVGAQEYERQLRNELLAGNYKKEETKALTVDEFFPVVLKTADVDNKSSTTAWKEQTYRLYLKPSLGGVPLDRIDAGCILDLKSTLKNMVGKRYKKPLGKKTQNNALGVLVRILNLAVTHKHLATFPEVKLHGNVTSDWTFLDFDEAERLIAAADGQDRTMLVVAIRTGLRIGELVALQWSDVDLVAGKVTVNRRWYKGEFALPKSNRTREVPLSAQALAELKAQKARTFLKGGDEFVFISVEEGVGMFRPDRANKRLKSIRRKAGVKNISYHDLRHTFASHLVMRNVVALKQVQAWMGHQSITQTEKYAHLAPDANRRAVDALDGGPVSSATLAQHGFGKEKTPLSF